MGSNLQFFEDLTVALSAAAIGGWAANRVGLNAILGYIVAGIAIGPFTPGYVAHGETIANLAELGLVFLLFSIGLAFSPSDLVSAGLPAIATGAAVMAALAGVFWATSALLGFAHPITLALIAVASSTAIAAALLRDWNLRSKRIEQLAIALLVAQDLAAVALLVVVDTPASGLHAVDILVSLAKAIGFVAVALILGATILHRFVIRMLQSAATEALFGIFAALALVASWLAQLFDLSLDFGAFVAGAVISEAAATQMVQAIVTPFRALFVALFFVSIGMLIDPKLIITHWSAIAVLGLGFGLVRFAGWTAVGRAGGLALPSATFMGLAMVPLGEFNIVLANAASAANRISSSEQSLIIGVTFISILLAALGTPLLRRLPIVNENDYVVDGKAPEDGLVAIIGFGRVGRTVADTLSRCAVSFVVLENDRDTVARSRAGGFQTVAGDARDPTALDRVVSPSTRVILAVTSDTATNAAVARRYEHRSEALIIARAAQSDDVPTLLRHRVAAALVPETEGALSFAAATLRGLGFADDRIDAAITAQRETMTQSTG